MSTNTTGVLAALKFLSECYQGLNVEPATIAAWEAVLGRHPTDLLLKAAKWVARTHRYGAPCPAHLMEYLEGRIESTRVPVTDLYNRVVLDGPGGAPRYEVQQLRVFPDGRSEPCTLPDRDQVDRPRVEPPSAGPSSIGEALSQYSMPEEPRPRSIPDHREGTT